MPGPLEGSINRRKLFEPGIKRVSWEDVHQGSDEKQCTSVNLCEQQNLVNSDLATTQDEVQHLKTGQEKVNAIRKLFEPSIKQLSWEDVHQELDEEQCTNVNLWEQLNLVTFDLARTQAEVQQLKLEHSKANAMVKSMQTKIDEIALRCLQTDVAQKRWKQESCRLQETQEEQALQSATDVNELKARVAALEKTESKASDALRDAVWALKQMRADSGSAKTAMEERTNDVHQDLKTMDLYLKQSFQTARRREMQNQVGCTHAEVTQQANHMELGRDTKRMNESHSMDLLELHDKVSVSKQSNLTKAADPIDVHNVTRKVAGLGLERQHC